MIFMGFSYANWDVFLVKLWIGIIIFFSHSTVNAGIKPQLAIIYLLNCNYYKVNYIPTTFYKYNTAGKWCLQLNKYLRFGNIVFFTEANLTVTQLSPDIPADAVMYAVCFRPFPDEIPQRHPNVQGDHASEYARTFLLFITTYYIL